MRSLADLSSRDDRHRDRSLTRMVALTRTLAFRHKLDKSRDIVSRWLGRCERPIVSCGGGKDSTALLLVVQSVGASVPVYRADPPNPLPDRPDHVARLEQAHGGRWVIVPYPWDVEGVLAGEIDYPAMLKVRRLEERMRADGVDAVALGNRTAESRGRMMNWRLNGPIYRRRDGLLICTPIATWTAEEVIGYTLATDRVPLNPVYRRLRLSPDLEHLRDGTWYPREVPDTRGYREWLATHYPEVADLYDRALIASRR